MEERLHRGERLLLRDARLETPEDVDPPAAPIVEVVPVRGHLRFEHQWNANARRLADVETIEPRLRDADDCDVVVVDRELAPNDVPVCAEAIAPVVVTEHRHEAVAADLVVVGRDDAAEGRADAEHLEVGAGDQFADDALGLTIDADAHRDRPPREHPGEDCRRWRWIWNRLADARRLRRRAAIHEAVAVVLVHRVRDHVAARIVAVMVPRPVEQDELFRGLDRKHAEQHFIDECENRGIRADSECDRQQRDGGEQRRPCKPSPRIAQIASQMTHTAC